MHPQTIPAQSRHVLQRLPPPLPQSQMTCPALPRNGSSLKHLVKAGRSSNNHPPPPTLSRRRTRLVSPRTGVFLAENAYSKLVGLTPTAPDASCHRGLTFSPNKIRLTRFFHPISLDNHYLVVFGSLIREYLFYTTNPLGSSIGLHF